MSKEMLYVLIVEDEPSYAKTLEIFVEKLGYQAVGIADHAEQAMLLFQQNVPDLVLMDIHIKGEISGIALSQKMQKIRTVPIIFITSYDDPETFEKAKVTAPSAYLIKPFDPDQLERSMELAMMRAHSPQVEDDVFEKNRHVVLAKQFFFVKERNKLVKVNIEDIIWGEVEDKYCTLHTKDKKFVIRLSIKELSEKLNPENYVQVHRSYIINITKADYIDLSKSYIEINNKVIPLGRSFKENLVYRLQKL